MLVVRGSRVILPEDERPASVHIENGVIVRVGRHDEVPVGARVFDAADRVLSPGLVDTHVHVNEPGRTEWEGFDTATRAAAAGGVTTIVDMPLNSVPATTTVGALALKREAARSSSHVDVAFWGGVVPGNAGELDALVDAGVRGFKCFLAASGVEEFPAVVESDLRVALPIIARRDVPLLVHAELPSHLTHPAHQAYSTYLASRPPAAEVEAIDLMVRLASDYGARVHIVHVACAEAVATIERAKAAGVPITAETCPHYLTFSSDEIPAGATEFKCAPPIREAWHRDALWNGLTNGVLDLVATDHSPSPPELKSAGDFSRAWGGIASLELSLSAVWTGATERDRSLRAIDMIRWMSTAPAALAGLGARKGRIVPGWDADLIVWDPNADRVIAPGTLQQRHKLTPYAHRRLRGVVTTTFLRGQRIWDDGALVNERGGQLL